MEDEAPDSGDLDALYDLERHTGYFLVRYRITEELERCREALLQDADAIATAKLRGMASAFSTSLRILQILITELKGQLKE